MTKEQLVEGAVASVRNESASKRSSIVVNKTPFKVAPSRHLPDNDFTLAAGEAVHVSAAPSNVVDERIPVHRDCHQKQLVVVLPALGPGALLVPLKPARGRS
jgi:hypothetical protein